MHGQPWLDADRWRPADAGPALAGIAIEPASWAGIEHPRAWVRTVASREYFRRAADCHDSPAAEISNYHVLPIAAGADEAAMLGPEQAHVLKVLRLLPPRQRQVMAWVYDGYTPAEIASILNLDPGAVRASLHKARATLKHHLMEGESRS